MSMEDNMLKEILDGREKRAEIQRKLINTFKTTLVSFTLNIPGKEKNNAIFSKAHEKGICLLEEEFRKENISVIYKEVNKTSAGLEAFFNIDGDSMFVKKITVSIEEESHIGRLFDLDVFTSEGKQVSRTELGLPQRKCLLCDDNAKVCGRMRKHSTEELICKINQLINNFI
ncbi:citrate lyase holo-[acyl-carrier protein] synthase [Clostridium sp. SHJSY1]|uniref:citrate lyase holo-[acyl-carrier protein] synthase n=1 Tax=Clostridium sp. SHJSY1 TaxID=2942483 RepID=UPI002875E81C|nr:citrate lyase holo-[acyl-carrier protein] synthase [Clostridium sp. SHJSY1]MDS0526496.1 citrate lyase holo-[acyl-carrier protein] synthase [Clostridium sp. SHJSY1]